MAAKWKPGLGYDVDLSSFPVVIERVQVHGLTKTKDDLLEATIKELFKATTLESMVLQAQKAKLRMEAFRIFSEVEVFIDTCNAQGKPPDAYQVQYTVKELKGFSGGIHTLMGTNTASVNLSLSLPNVFGRAERLRAEFSYGTKHANSISLSFAKPLRSDPRLLFSCAVLQNYNEMPWNFLAQTDRGVTADLSFVSRVGTHKIRWDGIWRELAATGFTTPLAVREASGHSLKSSVYHSWSYDTRDHGILPSTGYMLNCTQEFAGLGGDVRFLKTELEVQANKKLPLIDTVLQLSLAGGAVRSLKPANPTLNIADRFVLGGPLTLRGFRIQGCGPHSECASLGGNTYWILGAHVYTPLPFQLGQTKLGSQFRTHAFINAGSLVDLQASKPWNFDWRNAARVTYGVGLVMNLGDIARVEVNYCIPAAAQKYDRVVSGMQFGIGLKFL